MRRSRLISWGLALTLAVGMVAGAPRPAEALSPDLPFSADALPTWQTNGVVWDMAASQGRMVVGGSFTQIRPGAGQSGSARNVAGLAILDAATGQPASCQLPAAFSAGNAIIYAVDAAPGGGSVFVGGQFTSIGGTSVSRLAEIDVVTCRVLSFRAPSISSSVLSIEVANDAVYFGGLFQTVGGQQRRSFAKVNRAGALQPWVVNAYGATVDSYTPTVEPDKNARGDALVLSPDGTRLAIGGNFFYVNGTATHSFAVVDGTSGSLLRSWPANTVGNTSRTKTIVSDGTRFYVGNEGFNGYDGNIAYNWSDYSQAWRDNCAGATQALLPYQGVLFKAHHHHDCSSMGMFPDGRRIYLTATHAADPTQFQIGWTPELNDGTGEGLGPRALAVGAGSNGQDYLWVAGEFTRVNGANQQSLTRFSGTDTGAPPTPSVAARVVTPNQIQVNIRGVYDPDDSDITYAVYRGSNTTTPVWTGVARSQHWYRHQVTFVDSNVTPGTSYSYRVRAIDAAGNQSALSSTVTATASATASPYASAVIADQPRWYYRYDDPSGSPWVMDSSGQTVQGLNGLAENGVTRTAAGAIPGDASRSATFSEGNADGTPQYIWNDVIATGPSTYSVETWFRTTSTSGGALVNYGSSQGRPRSDNGDDRVSNTVDRVVYMESATGRLRFGVRSGQVQTLRSDNAYNDGQWHHVVATQGPGGMRLYVDGALVAQNSITGNQSYNGTWHVGGDNLSAYPGSGSQASQRYFDGQLDETAVYYGVLAEQRVLVHYAAGGGDVEIEDTTAPSVPGDVSTSVSATDVGVSWSASTDDVAVVGYAVYRGTSEGFTADASSQIGQVSGTSYTDEDRPVGTWFYKVSASDAAGNSSAASSAASATVEAPQVDPIVQTVSVTADTMVAAVNPANVYGASNQISSRANTAIWSFLQFQLPAAPDGYVLESATLRLVTSSDPTAGSADVHQVHLVDEAWSEATTTWNTRPTTTSSGVIGELTGASALTTAYTVNLAAVSLAPEAGSNVTLRISSSSGSDNARFSSRESTSAAARPTLTLTYVGE